MKQSTDSSKEVNYYLFEITQGKMNECLSDLRMSYLHLRVLVLQILEGTILSQNLLEPNYYSTSSAMKSLVLSSIFITIYKIAQTQIKTFPQSNRLKQSWLNTFSNQVSTHSPSNTSLS